MLLRHLPTSVPSGVGSATPAPGLSTAASQCSNEEPPSTSGILPCILDSSASFHMTPNHTHLSSICPPSIPLTNQETRAEILDTTRVIIKNNTITMIGELDNRNKLHGQIRDI